MASKPGILKNQRSMTGNHRLMPASRPGSAFEPIPRVPTYTLITWTFGRGSVIWRIWPAVLLHTLFAAGVVTISLRKIVDLEIPSVMLTVLGVVIGFVISYRAISGYERYWMGRACWSDVIKNSRTLGRLIWFHVPLRTSPKTPEEIQSGAQRSPRELNKVMAEKRMALDLIEGFAVALKHHIRGELGIYFEDLYHLVRPMHDHDHTADDQHVQEAMTSALPNPRKAQRITVQPGLSDSHPKSGVRHTAVDIHETTGPDIDPIIPAINEYGTFDPSKLSSGSRQHGLRRSPSQSSYLSSATTGSEHQPLMPSAQPPTEDNVMDKVSGDLIPFAGVITSLRSWFRSSRPSVVLASVPSDEQPAGGRQWQGPIYSGLHAKHRPKVAGGGQNLPLEIVRCLSEWFSVLEDRGSVPGTSLGTMIGTIAALEDSLTALERILTTPLPFVYSVHIRTVWVYLFFLPFQLVAQFGYYTIPGVAIASFIYLGFIAAGEEIEQPFGYDDNDLDLDLFCHAIVQNDIKHLKTSPCLNAYFGPDLEESRPAPRRSMTLTEITGSELNETPVSGIVDYL